MSFKITRVCLENLVVKTTIRMQMTEMNIMLNKIYFAHLQNTNKIFYCVYIIIDK